MNRLLRVAVLFARCCAGACAVFVLAGAAAWADEIRPAYLELREVNPGEFNVLWQTPRVGDVRLALEPEFSGDATLVSPATTQTTGGSAIATWTLRAPALSRRERRIPGLGG